MNIFEQVANQKIAVFEQQKAECRLASLRFFDRLSVPEMELVLAELTDLQDESKSTSGGRSVVMQLGLLEMDSLLAEWMATQRFTQ